MVQDNTKLCDFSNTNNNDFLSTPIAPLTDAESCEINAALLNLVMKDQFAGLPSEDAATHLNNFVDLCDMQKKKHVDNDMVKLKLFPFSLRDHAKTWFSSLPKNSIDSWNKCKDDFISKYSPPAKIISLRNDVMNFKQLDHEHVAQAREKGSSRFTIQSRRQALNSLGRADLESVRGSGEGNPSPSHHQPSSITNFMMLTTVRE